jgi:hypothetical protein
MARRNICRFVSRSSRYESECCKMVFLQNVRKFENLCEHKSLCEKLEPQVLAVLLRSESCPRPNRLKSLSGAQQLQH